MDFVEAIVLGIVQGLTEFLPISSSGHLILVPWLFGWEDPGLVFDVALHAGTLGALVAYYWRTWIELLQHDRRLLGMLLAGSVPAGIIGLLGERISEQYFRAPWQVGVGLVAFGLLLYWADHREARAGAHASYDRESRVGARATDDSRATVPGQTSRWGERRPPSRRSSTERRSLTDLGWRDALLIGGAQGLAALFPGTSRSGITITAALLLGYKRETSATVSFLLATPITAAALLWAGRHLLGGREPPVGAPLFAVGILVSAIAGFLAIHVLLRYVRSHSYTPFVVYRVVVGVLVILLAVTRG